jgi:hypothetical protein
MQYQHIPASGKTTAFSNVMNGALFTLGLSDPPLDVTIPNGGGTITVTPPVGGRTTNPWRPATTRGAAYFGGGNPDLLLRFTPDKDLCNVVIRFDAFNPSERMINVSPPAMQVLNGGQMLIEDSGATLACPANVSALNDQDVLFGDILANTTFTFDFRETTGGAALVFIDTISFDNS